MFDWQEQGLGAKTCDLGSLAKLKIKESPIGHHLYVNDRHVDVFEDVRSIESWVISQVKEIFQLTNDLV